MSFLKQEETIKIVLFTKLNINFGSTIEALDLKSVVPKGMSLIPKAFSNSLHQSGPSCL